MEPMKISSVPLLPWLNQLSCYINIWQIMINIQHCCSSCSFENIFLVLRLIRFPFIIGFLTFIFFSFLFWDRVSLCHSPLRLECSGTISVHCNLHFQELSDYCASPSQVVGITDTQHHTWLIFVFLVEKEVHYVGQAGLELLISSDPFATLSQSSGIPGVSHRSCIHGWSF